MAGCVARSIKPIRIRNVVNIFVLADTRSKSRCTFVKRAPIVDRHQQVDRTGMNLRSRPGKLLPDRDNIWVTGVINSLSMRLIALEMVVRREGSKMQQQILFRHATLPLRS